MTAEAAVEETEFVPDKITTYNPDGASVQVHPLTGAVRLAFFIYGSREVVNFNISPEASHVIREKLPASSNIVTPSKPEIILPG